MPGSSDTPTPAEITRALQRSSVEPPRTVRVGGRSMRRYLVKDGNRVVEVFHALNGRGWTFKGIKLAAGPALLRRLVDRMRELELFRAQLLPMRDLMVGMAKPYLGRSALATLASMARERDAAIQSMTKEHLRTVASADGRRIGRLVEEIVRLRAENKRLKTRLSQGKG